jgi:hypothetical protein
VEHSEIHADGRGTFCDVLDVESSSRNLSKEIRDLVKIGFLLIKQESLFLWVTKEIRGLYPIR